MAFRAAGLLLAALLVLPAAAAPKRDRKTADRRKALARLALWVAREGRDRVVEEAEAQVMGLRTSSDVPLRTVARAPGQSPDGRTRAVSLAYNSDGKVIKPVAFVFWRIDVSSSLPAGRTFLTGLDGSLARVLSVTEQPPDLGARHISVPVPADAPASAAGLREELDYWLSASR